MTKSKAVERATHAEQLLRVKSLLRQYRSLREPHRVYRTEAAWIAANEGVTIGRANYLITQTEESR